MFMLNVCLYTFTGIEPYKTVKLLVCTHTLYIVFDCWRIVVYGLVNITAINKRKYIVYIHPLLLCFETVATCDYPQQTQIYGSAFIAVLPFIVTVDSSIKKHSSYPEMSVKRPPSLHCAFKHACTFFLFQITDGIFKFVELQILNNHGNQMFTCLYRFRVHGIPSKQDRLWILIKILLSLFKSVLKNIQKAKLCLHKSAWKPVQKLRTPIYRQDMCI